MAKITNKQYIAASLLLCLGACSYIPNLGKDEEILGDKGARVAVMKEGTSLLKDPALEHTTVVVPSSKDNASWYKSSGHSMSLPENIKAPVVFSRKYSTSIGKGGSDEDYLTAGPVVAGGRVYTIDSEGVVTSFDVQTLNRKWKYKIELSEDKVDFTGAGMVYYQGKIFIATGYNRVVALSAENGQVLWRRNINSVARSAPEVARDTVFVNTIDNTLYALDAKDGGILWNHSGMEEDISMVGSASPISDGNLVFAPYSSGELYALKVIDGSEAWFDNLTATNGRLSYAFSDIDAAPIIVGNIVYAISSDGVLTASEVYSGKRIWEREVSGSQTPWYAGSFIYLINDANEVLCISAKTGGIKWASQLPSYRKPEHRIDAIRWSGPVMAGDRLLVVGSNGKLHSISPENGEVVATESVPKDIYIAPVVAYDRVFLLTNAGKMLVLSEANAMAVEDRVEPVEAVEVAPEAVEGPVSDGGEPAAEEAVSEDGEESALPVMEGAAPEEGGEQPDLMPDDAASVLQNLEPQAGGAAELEPEAKKPSIFGRAWGGVKGAAGSVKNATKSVTNKITGPW